jgi:lactate permease
MNWIMPAIALLPILAVGILMVGIDVAFEQGHAGGVFACGGGCIGRLGNAGFKARGRGLAGFVNALDILVIVFGAILILQLMKKSGGMDGISQSMASVSGDRRVQALIIAWLFGSFLEGAAGFGTPAAVAAPYWWEWGFRP